MAKRKATFEEFCRQMNEPMPIEGCFMQTRDGGIRELSAAEEEALGITVFPLPECTDEVIVKHITWRGLKLTVLYGEESDSNTQGNISIVPVPKHLDAGIIFSPART